MTAQPTKPPLPLRHRLVQITGSPERSAEVLVQIATWANDEAETSKFATAIALRTASVRLLREADHIRRAASDSASADILGRTVRSAVKP